MGFVSKSNMSDDWDVDEPDIYARMYYLEKDMDKIKQAQEDQALFFALLMKKYNVTLDEIRAEGKTLC